MAVQIKRCNCSGAPAADFQDKTYGKGMRVMNEDAKKATKCTVCGTLHK
jgi:hypothetical protein